MLLAVKTQDMVAPCCRQCTYSSGLPDALAFGAVEWLAEGILVVLSNMSGQARDVGVCIVAE